MKYTRGGQSQRVNLLTILDIALSLTALSGSLLSYRAVRQFEKDVMQRLFGFVAAALLVLGAASMIEAVFITPPIQASAVLFASVGIGCTALVIAGVVSFLRWK